MKTIPIVTYKEGVSTLILLKTCVESTPPGGLDIPAIRARLKVSDVIEKAEKPVDGVGLPCELIFEDAVYATAQDCIRQTRWIKPERHTDSFAAAFGV